MGVKVGVSGNVSDIVKDLLRRWPNLLYGVLSEIGYQGRRALYENYLGGQWIRLWVYPRDKANKRTVTYKIGRKRSFVKISSYPANLHNPRALYSTASSTVEGRIQTQLNEIDKRYLGNHIEKLQRQVTTKDLV